MSMCAVIYTFFRLSRRTCVLDSLVATQADLDIQYMMGVSPGIATEFWEWPGNAFCSDLNDYTTALLDATDPPLVNSISYGWQGNLTKIGCSDADVKV